MKILDSKSVITNYNLNLRIDKIDSEIDCGVERSTTWMAASEKSFNFIYDLRYYANCIENNSSIVNFGSRLICTFIPEDVETDAGNFLELIKCEENKMKKFITKNIFISSSELDLCEDQMPDQLKVDRLIIGIENLKPIGSGNEKILEITSLPHFDNKAIKVEK